MSVSLLIEYHNVQKKPRIVPIATEILFENYWQPASTKLGLKWIPLFQSGFPIGKDDIAAIIDELTRLKQFISTNREDTLPAEQGKLMASRIETLIAELSSIKGDAEAEGYIS